MIKLGIKIAILLSLAGVINGAVFRFFQLPFSWGNSSFYNKETYWRKNQTQYNTIFVGTSRTFRQINPVLFDSITNHETQSFNFGVIGISAAQVYYYLDKIIGNREAHLKYVFLELTDFDIGSTENMHTINEKYWLNLSDWWFTINCIVQSNYGFREKIKGLFFNTIPFIEQLLKFDMLKDVWQFKIAAPNSLVLGENSTGFVPAEEEKMNPEALLEKRNAFLKDTSINETRSRYSTNVFNKTVRTKLVSAHLIKLTSLISRLHKMGIEVFVLLPPRMREVQYANTIPIFENITGSPKINLADGAQLPEFYEMRYSFDAGHLNKEGAEIFTRKLATAFIKLKSKND